MSRRSQIVMDAAEVAALLDESHTVTCATIGRDGRPHLMPLWYVVRAGRLWSWTYAKSQKVRNLERDERCTLQVEAGTEYAQLRGVMFDCDAVIHRDVETVAALGMELGERYWLPGEGMAAQAPKRVALEFVERRRRSWDHRKLGGTY